MKLNHVLTKDGIKFGIILKNFKCILIDGSIVESNEFMKLPKNRKDLNVLIQLILENPQFYLKHLATEKCLAHIKEFIHNDLEI